VPDTDSDDDTVPDCLDQCPGVDDRIDTNDNDIPDCTEKSIIPTTSAWGLVVLTAALFFIARRAFNRRHGIDAA
jgi:hypothetical protein